MQKQIPATLAAGKVYQSLQMADLAMDTAIGEQPQKMHRTLRVTRVGECFEQFNVLKERSIFNSSIDTGKVLVDNPAGAEIQMTYLGVAHLARRQAHGLTGRIKGSVRIFPEQPVQVGRARQRNGVTGTRRGNAPAIEHNQTDK